MASELIVEPRVMQEYRPNASSDSPTSDLYTSSLLSKIQVQYSTKLKCTWITGIPCNKDDLFWNPLYFHSYRRLTSLGILSLMLVLTTYAFCDPQLDRQRKLFIHYLERNSNFLILRNYLTLMYSFSPRPITFLLYGIASCRLMCRFLRTSDSANFLLKIQATSTFMIDTFTFLDLYQVNFKLLKI